MKFNIAPLVYDALDEFGSNTSSELSIMSISSVSNFARTVAVLPSSIQVTSSSLNQEILSESLVISIAELGIDFSATVSGISKQLLANTQVEYAVETSLYENATVIINLIGELEEDGLLKIQKVGIYPIYANGDAKSRFVTCTFLAAVLLADKVSLRLPDGVELSLSFQSSALEISKVLEHRQVSYRIMVVERATGYKFKLPTEISAQEMSDLWFIYHAVVYRSFSLPHSSMYFHDVRATRENLEMFVRVNRSSSFALPPHSKSKTFLGKDISLGDDVTSVIENPVIEDFDRVKDELARDDKHPVEIVIRSVSGEAVSYTPSAPKLPDKPWNPLFQKLINLESDLDSRLAKRYHELATGTLSGLSDEERGIATARPELDIDVNSSSVN